MIIPVVASGDIALIPAIRSLTVLRILAVVPKVVVEYAVPGRVDHLQTDRAVADIILINLVFIREVQPDARGGIAIQNIVANGVPAAR